MNTFYFNRMTDDSIGGFLGVIKSRIYEKVIIPDIKFAVTKEPVPFHNKLSLTYKDIKTGERWADNVWDCAWFNLSGVIPGENLRDNLFLCLDLSGEACVFDEYGCPVRGLTNINSNFDRALGEPGKKLVPFSDGTFSFDPLNLWVEAGCNDLFGDNQGGIIRECMVVKGNERLRKLYHDYRFLWQLSRQVSKDTPLYYSIMYALQNAFLCFSDRFSDEEITRAEEFLRVELERTDNSNLLNIYAVGHSHIDLAWLWPLRETRRKAARTFSTAIANIKDYPDYVFAASQPQQYEWVKEDYPELFEKIKAEVKRGRIEPVGAMWAEADVNIPCGESLVRQILYGKKFFFEEFGVEVDTMWLPDSFGYSGVVPTLMKHSNLKYFISSVLKHRPVNDFPHTTFIWKGSDGSEALAHILCEGTYNSLAAPESVIKLQKGFLERGKLNKALMLYGIGDGGGGPGEEHLENIKRIKDVYGLPRVKSCKSSEFFSMLEKNKERLSSYTGELYLELHQGTYTTAARLKKLNLQAERNLDFLEKMSVVLNADYDKKSIEKAWKKLLLYQFHDILPGTSINRVFEESENDYNEINSAINSAFDEIVSGGKKGVSLFNGTQFEFNYDAYIDGEWKAYTLKPLSITNKAVTANAFSGTVDNACIENASIKACFNANGELVSYYDKLLKREMLKAPSNRHIIYNDYGNAWNTYINYQQGTEQAFKLISTRAYIDGPFGVVEKVFGYNASQLKQEFRLSNTSNWLEITSRLDWNESNKLMRTMFSFNISTDSSTGGRQFGSCVRHNTGSNSDDYAHYEVCAHKWFDVSQTDCGVAILSADKYGFSATNSNVGMSVIRSISHPSCGVEKGVHTYRYAFYSHSGDAYCANVNKQSYIFCNPPKVLNVSLSAPTLATINSDGVIIETIKPYEYGGGIVLRLYESRNSNVSCKLMISGAKRAFITDIDEKAMREIEIENGTIPLDFSPFELKNIHIITE